MKSFIRLNRKIDGKSAVFFEVDETSLEVSIACPEMHHMKNEKSHSLREGALKQNRKKNLNQILAYCPLQ